MTYVVFQIPGGNYYLYDREKNAFLHIDDTDASSIQGHLGDKAKEECIARFQSQGLCLPTRLKKIEHPDLPFLSQLTSYHMGEMVLQVTQNCNLRCEYCVYSGTYYGRTHTAKRMSTSTAFRAVDFLMQHSLDRDELNIGFYGGEPLLEIDLIKKVIAYVEKEYVGKKVKFGLTTNATLLTDETADFLADKGVDLLISLDGPEEYQDLQRCFVNGKGTFKVVMDNLARLHDRHPEYFKLLRINTVVPPGRDGKKIVDFFSQHELLSETDFRISKVVDVRSKEEVRYDESLDRAVQIEITKAVLYGLGYLQIEQINKSFLSFFADLSYTYKIITCGGGMTETSHPGGPCTPGVRRVFVDVDGRLFPCERIGESEDMQIGTIDTGFEEHKIVPMLNVGQLTEKQCRECWAFSLCSQCIALSLDGERVSASKRLSRCLNVRSNVLSSLRDIAFLMENGFDFEKFTNIWE